jgi:hypothetical protein
MIVAAIAAAEPQHAFTSRLPYKILKDNDLFLSWIGRHRRQVVYRSTSCISKQMTEDAWFGRG